jgi:hypothetical protein
MKLTTIQGGLSLPTDAPLTAIGAMLAEMMPRYLALDHAHSVIGDYSHQLAGHRAGILDGDNLSRSQANAYIEHLAPCEAATRFDDLDKYYNRCMILLTALANRALGMPASTPAGFAAQTWAAIYHASYLWRQQRDHLGYEERCRRLFIEAACAFTGVPAPTERLDEITPDVSDDATAAMLAIASSFLDDHAPIGA